MRGTGWRHLVSSVGATGRSPLNQSERQEEV